MTEQTIAVTINGRPTAVTADLTVAALLEQRGVHTTLVAVEQNGRVLKRSEFPTITIQAGDRLEIVHFVGGG